MRPILAGGYAAVSSTYGISTALFWQARSADPRLLVVVGVVGTLTVLTLVAAIVLLLSSPEPTFSKQPAMALVAKPKPERAPRFARFRLHHGVAPRHTRAAIARAAAVSPQS